MHLVSKVPQKGTVTSPSEQPWVPSLGWAAPTKARVHKAWVTRTRRPCQVCGEALRTLLEVPPLSAPPVWAELCLVCQPCRCDQRPDRAAAEAHGLRSAALVHRQQLHSPGLGQGRTSQLGTWQGHSFSRGQEFCSVRTSMTPGRAQEPASAHAGQQWSASAADEAAKGGGSRSPSLHLPASEGHPTSTP